MGHRAAAVAQQGPHGAAAGLKAIDAVDWLAIRGHDLRAGLIGVNVGDWRGGIYAQARVEGMELAALVASGNVRSMPYDAHDVLQAASLAELALPLARALGDLRAEARIEHSLALLHIHGDRKTEAAVVHIESSARLARLAGDAEALGLALLILGTLRLTRGQIAPAEAAWLEAVDLFRRADDRPRQQDAAHLLAMLCLGAGMFDRTLTSLHEAYSVNEALGNATETFAIVTTRNVVHIIRGEYDRAFEGLAPLADVDENSLAQWMLIAVHQQLAWLYYELGAYDMAQDQCRQALGYADGGQPALHAPGLTVLTLNHLGRGEWSPAADAAAQGLAVFDREGMLYPEWWEALAFPLAEGEANLARGDIAPAASCAAYLLEKYEAQGLRHLLPGILFFSARVALAQGDQAAALSCLNKALTLSDEMGAHREVWAMCAMLGELEAERGNFSIASQMRARARTEVTFVADHAGSPVMRATFLARPDVSKVVALSG